MTCICRLMGDRSLLISDVLRLKISDIYKAGGQVKERLVFKSKKTKNIFAYVLKSDAPSNLVKSLEVYYKEISHLPKDEPMFYNNTHRTPLKDIGVRKILEGFRGPFIDRVSPNSFRKRFGTTLHNNFGYSIEAISRYFHHSNVSITRRHLQISERQSDEMAQKLDML